MYAAIILSLCLTSADVDAETAVRVALALAAQQQAVAQPVRAGDDYVSMRARAIAENKTLVVHVGVWRADIVQGMPEALHCYQGSFAGSTGGLVVGVPRNGELWRVADIGTATSLGAVRSYLPASESVGRSQVYYPQPQSRPVYFSPPARSSGGC